MRSAPKVRFMGYPPTNCWGECRRVGRACQPSHQGAMLTATTRSASVRMGVKNVLTRAAYDHLARRHRFPKL
jgi:hypothetical protein